MKFERLLKGLNPVAALVDQAWLSLLNLLLAITLIRIASKEDYGVYLLFVAPLLLLQSVQNALINSPLATFLPIVKNDEQASLIRTAVGIHCIVGVVGFFVSGVGAYFFFAFNRKPIDGVLLFGFSLAALGTVVREAQRSIAYAQGKGVVALAGDAIYGLVLIALVAYAFWDSNLTAATALGATGIAGLCVASTRLRLANRFELSRKHLVTFWSCGKWALPAVLVTWVTLSAYPFFAGRTLGLSAVAEIGAARLFLMPVGLAITAWSNWFRPRISGWLAAGNVGAVRKLTYKSALLGTSFLVLGGVLICYLYPVFEHFLGSRYSGLLYLILLWLIFFALTLCRNVFMATLMTDADGYKLLHHISWLALFLSLPGFVFLSENGPAWVVLVLCFAEFLQLVLVTRKAQKYWRRHK